MKSALIFSKGGSGRIGAIAAFLILLLIAPSAAFAQGSITGTVTNSDATTPADGDISFVGFLDNTDEEIRIETSDGAGYTSGNWYDDFQNYLTEAAGNPYDYYFVNTANGEAYHLEKLIPSNSFQQEDITLASASLPSAPTGLAASAISTSSMLVTWNGSAGLTYHVYRRVSTSNGSYFRIDNTSGSLSDPGVSTEYFVDNTVNGTASYTYLVIAEDASGSYSAHSGTVTASSATPEAPTVAAVNPSSGQTAGGTNVTISGSGFDQDGLSVTFGGTSATNVTVVSPMEITCTTPAGSGTVDVVVTNTASGLAGTLTGGYSYFANDLPIADAGPDQLGQFKNEIITLDGSGSSDPNNDPLSYHWSQVSGPETVTLSDTNAVDPSFTVFTNGDYYFELIVDDGFDPSAPDTVYIQIVERAPILASIGAQGVTEGTNLNFGVSATDPDGTTPALTAENVPTNATFSDNGDGTGVFDFNPDFTQEGLYTVRFIASDGIAADTELVEITVADAGNQAPVLASIGAQSVTEGGNLNFGVSATDADGTDPALTAENVPANATFTDNGDGTGVFDFNPDFTQAGLITVTFIASDGVAADTELVEITVNDAGNQIPVLASIGSQTVTEGQNLNFGVTATDADGTDPTLTAENVPANATFTDNGDGTGTFDFDPDFTQAGLVTVRFIASDGVAADTELVDITVNDAGNQDPVLAAIGAQSVTEGQNLNLGVSATDPDGTDPILTAEDVPVNATFTDNGDGTGTFDFTPGFTQAGSYTVRFIASDGVAADTELVPITVNEAGNQAPIIATIGDQSVTEGTNLNFTVSATDPDEEVPSLTAEDVPTNATFTDNGDGTGTFDFDPDFTQAGLVTVRFIASDGVAADTELVDITINDAGNQAPVLDPIGPQTVTEGANLNFAVSASDVDAQIPALTAEDLPANATFTDNGDGTGVFDFYPDFTQAGLVTVRFIASDGVAADTELVDITINEAGNQTPVLATIGAQSVTEGQNLNLGVSATDPDGTVPSLTAEDVPANATFTDNGDGTGTFDFNPDFTQAGLVTVRFIASDGVAADTELVDITINDAGNQAPVLASIGAQTVTEGSNLNFGVSATDPDAEIPLLTAENVPTNATFTDNGDGTGVFDFDPDYTQAGLVTVRFIASDGVAADTELVDITIADAGNQTPILASIGAQGVTEGQNLNFGVSATDPDGTTPSLTAEDIPANATFTDNGDGTGTFDFDPDFTQAGLVTVRFIASDGVAADTELVDITINDAGNQAPVLDPIGPQTVTEGANLNFSVSASDADAQIPALTAENLPVNATFTDNGDGTGVFDFDPDYTQAGLVTVRFIASDGVAADTELVDITINEAGNQTPVLAAIGAQGVTEGSNLNFGVSATDPDGTTPSLTAEDIPANATFTDNGDGTGVFDFNPDFTQAGLVTVRFIASDGVAADTELVDITIADAGNQAPVLDPIGPQTVTEGANLNFAVSASDVDAQIPALTAEDLPANATFTDNGDGTGVFDFYPDFTQAGLVTVRFIASDGVAADTELVDITINEAGNQTPVLASIGAQGVTEGANLNFGVSATDPDGTVPSLTAEDVPANATFTDNGDGTGTFDFNPDFTQAGLVTVRFIASDGVAADTELVDITIADAGNQAPVLDPIGPQTVTEGANLNFAVSASDADAQIPALTAENLPVNATFTDNGDGTGVFDFDPDYTQAGLITVRFIASDGVAADTELVDITVNEAGNQTPVLAAIGAQGVIEGANLNFGVSAVDPDSTIPTLTAEDIPLNATFTDNGDGTGTFDFNPDFTQVGTYSVRFIASDGVAADSELVEITVNEAGNQTPILATIGAQSVTEGTNLNFAVSAVDPDSTIPALAAENLPVNATFTDNGDGTGVFDFNPDFTQAGLVTVRFIASDGVAADTELVDITINEAGNQIPILASIGAQGVAEGSNLNFSISAIDPDSTIPALLAEDVPANATFTDNGDGTGTFDFNPDFTQAGLYTVRFIASDGVAADTELVDITVADAGNQAPILDPIGPQTVAEGAALNLTVTASDPDSTALTLTAEDVPLNATFTDNGDNTGTFDFAPDFTQAGLYTVRFIVSDGVAADSELVEITVTDENLAPVIADIDSQFVDEGTNLNFIVSAIDQDGVIPTLTAVNMPFNATFVDSGDGTGVFDFSPDQTQAGEYTVTFVASDGVLDDSLDVIVTVNPIDVPPVIDPIASQSVNILDTLLLTVTASDADGEIPALTALNLMTNASFVDSGNGIGGLEFYPDATQEGVYFVTFIATAGALADTQAVQITVTDLPNQPPSFAPVDSQVVLEGGYLQFLVRATDPEGDNIDLVLTETPDNYTFVDSGNGAGVYSLGPDYFQSGTETVKIAAIDDGDPEAGSLLEVQVTIVDVNRPPLFDSIPPQSVLLGDSLLLRVVATDSTDPNGGQLILSALDKPLNSVFVDSGDGIGGFNFKPTADQVGVDTAKFICYDDEDPPLSRTITVPITIVSANQPPVLTEIGPQTVTEDETLVLNISATDVDGPFVQLYTGPLPNNSTFVDSGNGVGTFEFSPDFTQSGLISVKFYATDGMLTDNESVLIQIYDNPQPPTITVPADPDTITEGEGIAFNVSAVDPDSTIPMFMVDSTDFPLNATFTDNGDGTASFTFSPVYVQSGEYSIDFIAFDDDELADTGTVVIVVLDAGNQLPVFEYLTLDGSNQSFEDTIRIVELDDLSFDVVTTDADSTPPVLSAGILPGSATFTDNGDYTGTFEWTTTQFDQGTHVVKFYAVDGMEPTDVDSVQVAIVVENVNRPPNVLFFYLDGVFLPTGDAVEIDEGQTAEFLVEMGDPDNVPPIMQVDAWDQNGDSVVPMFDNVEVYDSTNNYGTVTFSPDYYQSRFDDYYFRVRAIDADAPDVYIEKFLIVDVINVPQEPVLEPITTPLSVVEGDSLAVVISYYDLDLPIGSSLTLSFEPSLENAGITNIDVNSSEFHFYPWFDQAGTYDLLFTITENAFSQDTQTVRIEVVEAGPQPPVMNVPFAPFLTVNLGVPFSGRISAVDPEGGTVTFSAINVPLNAAFVDSGNGAGSFSFDPDATQGDSTYNVTFIGSDGTLEDSVTVEVYVQEFICGDANGSQGVDVDDIVFLIAYIFQGGPAPDPVVSADVHRTDCPLVAVDIDDVTHLIAFVFQGGAAPDCECP